nr:helix-turn-helix domain-containing protein [Neosynechococcus sphagnicola]
MGEIEPCLEFQCPIQFVVDLIGNKWAILVLRELFAGDRRTHELLEALPGISTKILTQRLRELERHGLATRRVYAEVPPPCGIFPHHQGSADSARDGSPASSRFPVVGSRNLRLSLGEALSGLRPTLQGCFLSFVRQLTIGLLQMHRFLIGTSMFLGSTIGSYVPALWGGSLFSLTSILLGMVGGFLGIWLGFKLSKYLGFL